MLSISSQKAHLRVIRNIPKDRKILLAVEFFEAADQDKVDKYLSGKISEKEFLKTIRWQEQRGFLGALPTFCDGPRNIRFLYMPLIKVIKRKCRVIEVAGCFCR